jgi:DNA-binding LacI/PurR family transcriptional regulator
LGKLREIPHVWFMTRRSSTYPGDYVEPNNQENGQIAANYLFERGHKSVAVITTDPGTLIKPNKKQSTEKIDGVVALVMGLARATLHNPDGERSIYDERGIA